MEEMGSEEKVPARQEVEVVDMEWKFSSGGRARRGRTGVEGRDGELGRHLSLPTRYLLPYTFAV